MDLTNSCRQNPYTSKRKTNLKIEEFSNKLFDLSGKVAVVTGGATGMGQAFCYALASMGCDIVSTSHKNSPDKTCELVKALGRKIIVIKGDLRDKNTLDEIVKKGTEEFKKIDILVNNAGTIRRNPLFSHKDEDFEEVMDTNLKSVYYLSKKCAQIMAENNGGKIINIASMLSYQGGRNVVGYAASKHGIIGLTKAFANELAQKNIQVNAVAPGYVTTNNTRAILEDEKRRKSITDRIPMGYWAKPMDIAGAVVFLAGAGSNYITGATIPVDGGWLSN